MKGRGPAPGAARAAAAAASAGSPPPLLPAPLKNNYLLEVRGRARGRVRPREVRGALQGGGRDRGGAGVAARHLECFGVPGNGSTRGSLKADLQSQRPVRASVTEISRPWLVRRGAKALESALRGSPARQARGEPLLRPRSRARPPRPGETRPGLRRPAAGGRGGSRRRGEAPRPAREEEARPGDARAGPRGPQGREVDGHRLRRSPEHRAPHGPQAHDLGTGTILSKNRMEDNAEARVAALASGGGRARATASRVLTAVDPARFEEETSCPRRTDVEGPPLRRALGVLSAGDWPWRSYTLHLPDGTEYGPVDLATLQSWHAGGPHSRTTRSSGRKARRTGSPRGAARTAGGRAAGTRSGFDARPAAPAAFPPSPRRPAATAAGPSALRRRRGRPRPLAGVRAAARPDAPRRRPAADSRLLVRPCPACSCSP